MTGGGADRPARWERQAGVLTLVYRAAIVVLLILILVEARGAHRDAAVGALDAAEGARRDDPRDAATTTVDARSLHSGPRRRSLGRRLEGDTRCGAAAAIGLGLLVGGSALRPLAGSGCG